MPTRSRRLEELPPYVFAVIGDRIRKMQADGVDVLRLDIGNPDMPPPESVIEKLGITAREPGNHGYTGYRGKANFRNAIAEYYQTRFDTSLDPNTEILPVIGSKEGIINLSLAYLSPGDLSLVPDIGYPSYSMGARLAGAEFSYFKLDPNNKFLPELDSVTEETLEKAKLLWINYPNNPTGMGADLDDIRSIAEKCKAYDILVVSDNPYVDVTFDGNVGYSALQAVEDRSNVIEFFSLSKSHNMAGWRLGAALGPPDVIANLLQIKSNIDSGHFGPIYDAGVEALSTPRDWIDARNQVYSRRRDRVLATLPDIGLAARKSDGSLYVWAEVQHGYGATKYVEDALSNAYVSLAPGPAYGPGGEGYVRISLGVPDDRLDLAMDRLRDWYSGGK